MFPDYSRIKLQPLKAPWLSHNNIEAAMLRLDLLHPEVSGNKWFKLKYNIEAALIQQKDTLLTFGGTRSNHIAATAAAAPMFGLKSIGFIRGEASQKDNPTLKRAHTHGMQLRFLSRTIYRKRSEQAFLAQILEEYPSAFIIPEGGNNLLGIQGAKEILSYCASSAYSHICCPVGTGSTLLGIISATLTGQKTLGFSALKKVKQQEKEIQHHLQSVSTHGSWELLTDYAFGGFAKRSHSLDDFMKAFELHHAIPLDFIYTAKMMYGIRDLAEKDYFSADSRLLIIHTGGLQGNQQ